MNCPPAIAEIVLKIVREGLLLARAAGWEGDAGAAAREADHLHNLPDLLRDYTPEKVRFYCEVEVPSYVSECERNGISPSIFEPLWETLRGQLAAVNGSALTK